MDGLQRRYTLDEILEIKKGKPKIQGLNYDALRMLRDPLYVKFAQELKDEANMRQVSIADDQEFKLLLQRLARERNVPLDQLEELLRSLMKKPTKESEMQTDPTRDQSDTDMSDFNPEDERPGPPPPPSSGSSGPPPSSGSSGPPPPPSQGGRGNGTLGRYIAPETEREGDGSGWNMSRRQKRRGNDNDMDRPGGDDGSGGAGGAGASALLAANYTSNIQTQAQIQQLRDELRKQQRHDTIMREVRQNIPREDPIKEIVREFHQVMYPQPVPVPVPQDNGPLIHALQQAMAKNEDLSKIAQQMGLTMNQFIEFMRTRMQPPQQPEMSMAASSSDAPPPPPPPPPANRVIAKAKSEAILKPTEPPPIPINTPRVSRSRSRTLEPKAVSKTPTPAQASRDPSMASTVAYDDQFEAEEQIRKANRSRSSRGLPERQRGRSPTSKKDKIAEQIKIAIRSRSRHADDIVPDSRREPILPLEQRGRSPTNKIDKIADQIAKSQNRALVKGQLRYHLGRFASNVAASRRAASAVPNSTTATLAQPKKTTKTFDDIVAITEQPGVAEEPIKRKALPFGASIQKQRVDSRGLARERFGGRLVA